MRLPKRRVSTRVRFTARLSRFSKLSGANFGDAVAAQYRLASYRHGQAQPPDHRTSVKRRSAKSCLEVRLERKLSDAKPANTYRYLANHALVIPRASQDVLSRVTGQLLLFAPKVCDSIRKQLWACVPLSLSETTTDPSAPRTLMPLSQSSPWRWPSPSPINPYLARWR